MTSDGFERGGRDRRGDEEDRPPSVRIDAGTTGDADAVADMWVDLAESQRAHGAHLLGAPNRGAVREAALRHAVDDGLVLARDGDEPVGFVMFAVEGGSYEQRVDRGVVRNLYVRPAHRGRGIGGELLRAAERALADRGADRVSLEAMADNEAARRFYRRHGYGVHRVELEKQIDRDTR